MKVQTMSRRNFLRSAPLAGAAAGLAASAAPADAQGAPSGSRTLVACFSRSGNTRLVARQIRRGVNADLFEIAPAAEYPEDYETVVRQAQNETERGYRPPLRDAAPDLRAYDTILLGFPIWGMTAPPVIRSFLATHDLTDKTLVPFITHGGYGRGQSLKVLAEHAPRARLRDGFVMQADQERQSLAQVTKWLGAASFKRA